MFPAFKKLRKIDPNAERPFRAPGGPLATSLIAYVPVAMLAVSAVFSMFYPLDDGSWHFDTMLVAGTVAAIVAGEIVVFTTRENPLGLRQTLANWLYNAARYVEGCPELAGEEPVK